MFRKLIPMLLGFCLAGNVVAETYNVSVEMENNKILIRYTTIETNSAMCFLKNQIVNLEAPDGPDSFGPVSVKTALDMESPCLMAQGPNRGSLELYLGYNLPQLSDGIYELVIDAEHHGFLDIRGGQGVYL